MSDASVRMRVLLVDDDADVATMYETQLAAQGFEVIRAHSGAHDFLIKSQTPPGVLADATRKLVS
jgi:DNA-binding response OmpR family regulator